MSKPQQPATVVPLHLEAGAPQAARQRERRPRIGLRAMLRTDAVGMVEQSPQPDHQLTIHAGAPVRVTCRSRPARLVRYTRGDVNILPAGESGAWVEEEESTSLIVQLPPSLLRLAAEDMGLEPDQAGLEPRHHFRDPQIEHVAWALEAECRAGSPNGLLYLESLGMALAIHLLGRYSSRLEPRQGLSKGQVRLVTDYIEEHLDQSLSLARLSRVAGLSTSHLKTLFKRSMGLPVHEYVTQRRVERAKALLLRGEMAASQVALEAGFSHQSHMARWMRRILGVTPKDVARSARSP